MSEKQILTNSSLTTFKCCPRKYQFQYEMGMVPVRESEPLYFGSLIHFGLAEWSKHRNIAKTTTAVEAEFKRTGNMDEYLKAKVFALLEGYHNRYQGDNFKYIVIEEQFRAPILNPETAQESRIYEMGGVKDGIIQPNDSGRFILLERKTTSEDIEDPTAEYWQKLGMDSQLSTYFLGAMANGREIEYCLYDVIRKPTIRPNLATPIENRKYKKDGTLYTNQKNEDETPEEYYDRLTEDIESRPNFYYARKEVSRSKNDLEEFMFDTWNISQSLRAYQLKSKFPRFVNSCRNNFGLCQYFRVCSGQTSINDPEFFKKVTNVHPELK